MEQLQCHIVITCKHKIGINWNFQNKFFVNIYIYIMISGVMAGGAECPRHFSLGNVCWPTGKERQGKKGKWRRKQKRRKIKKGKVENWKWKEKSFRVTEWGKMRGCFCFVLFCFFAFYLTKQLKFVLVYQSRIFYREKAFHAGKKKSGKMTLPPQKYIPVTPLLMIYVIKRCC